MTTEQLDNAIDTVYGYKAHTATYDSARSLLSMREPRRGGYHG